MPYANNNGVKIYYEVEGEGPPMVLAHGGTDGGSGWRTSGYIDALRNDYQVIFFDFRGCGRSDKPHEASAFDRRLINNDVLTILDDLGIEKAHYFGYSGGSITGWLLAVHHAERFLSFIIGGLGPYGFSDVSLRGLREVVEGLKLKLADPEAYLQRRERGLGRPFTPEERALLLAGDAAALGPFIQSSIDWQPLTNQELSSISVPYLVFCGDIDSNHTGIKESIEHISKARFVSLPGLDHFTALYRSDLVLPHVKDFLAQVSKK